MQGITEAIWREKYRHDGEETFDDTVDRVVRGIYERDVSRTGQLAATEAALLMKRRLMVPAGRIWAGAGTGKRVTLINCFVSPDIQDSMDTIPGEAGAGIMDALKVASLSLQMGGGIGMDFSTVRPRGAVVKRTSSVSSGVLPFMDMWHHMSSTIMSAGHRRGAMMGTLRVDHPDVFDFVVAKHVAGRLTNFNLSVLVTDDFMQAVEDDAPWDIGFDVPRADGDHVDSYKKDDATWYVYRRLRARDLWDEVVRSTYVHAEPGAIFVDRVNKANNLQYCERIHCTNPCFAADTLIVTDKGAVPIYDLAVAKVPATIWDGTQWVTIDTFRETGRDQKMIRIELQDGSELRVTFRHRMILSDGSECEASALKIGSQLMLSGVTYDGDVEEAGVYLKGFALAEGHLHHNQQPQIWVYNPKYVCRDRLIKSAREIVSGLVRTNAITEFSFASVGERDCERMAGLAPLGDEMRPWCSLYKAGLPRSVFRWTRRSKTEFLAGLFDGDGGAVDTINGFSYQLWSIHRGFLCDVQTLLKSLGVRSKISIGKFAGVGGYSGSSDCWRLTISQVGSIKLSSIVQFSRLRSFADRSMTYDVKPRMSHVVAISEDGVDETVYCCTVPDTHRVALAIDIVTGQCGEQPLPANGNCNLGHVNLAEMVEASFTDQTEFRWDMLRAAAMAKVRFLDNVLDVSLYPTEAQKEEALSKRRIGIGYTGLGTAMQMLMIKYGSDVAVEMTRKITSYLRDAVYYASSELAAERGSFPLFDRDKFLAAPFVKNLPYAIKQKIEETGIRNGVLLTIAPTGTTSILVGNVSSGIEPSYLFKYDRRVLRPDGKTFDMFPVYDLGYLRYCEHRGLDPAGAHDLPDYMVTSSDLTVEEHLLTQAAAQEYVDSSISKTINCPESMAFEEFRGVYARAYALGLKGCTTYRPDPRSGRGAVLSAPAPRSPSPDPAPDKVPMQDVAEGRRYRIKWPGIDAAFYVVIDDYTDAAGVRRPFEMFIITKAQGHAEWISGLTRMVTAVFRREGDVTFVVDELKQVFSNQGGTWRNGRYVPSIVAMIGVTLEDHLRWLGLIKADDATAADSALPPVGAETCDHCGAPAVVREGGCKICRNCGKSDCG